MRMAHKNTSPEPEGSAAPEPPTLSGWFTSHFGGWARDYVEMRAARYD